MATSQTVIDTHPEGTAPIERDPVADSGDETDDDDESEVLEESPCGRWQKRREEVKQRDVPGIDVAFLAMDTEEGVEVVWNEVRISEKKSSKNQLDKIKQVFDNLIQLDHANIVKFHKYWTDTSGDKPRVVFITEYMSSGSLKQFLKKTKKNNKQLKAWKRWCTQILSALSYLHSCEPPIVHGNLTCDTIFIQQNGLVKIGSVAPDAIYVHVKTLREEARHMHYVAPEYAGCPTAVTPAVDMYAFGICALEIPGNGDAGHCVPEESIYKTLESLEDPLQRDFIAQCLSRDPAERPSARTHLFHEVLFEVHSLKLMAAHCIVKNTALLTDNSIEEVISRVKRDSHRIVMEIPAVGNRKEPLQYTFEQCATLDLERFLEDVKNGVYPLTAFAQTMIPAQPGRARAVSPELAESVKSETPEPADQETRLVTSMNCHVRPSDESETALHLTLTLRMDDQMNRLLTCEFTLDEPAFALAEELVRHGFICSADRTRIASLIEDSIEQRGMNGTAPGVVTVSA